MLSSATKEDIGEHHQFLSYQEFDSILLKEEADFIELQLLRNHTKLEIFVI